MNDELLTEKFLKAFGKKKYKVIYDVRKISDTELTICYFIKNNLTDDIDINFSIFDEDDKEQVIFEWKKQFNENDYEFVNATEDISELNMLTTICDVHKKDYFKKNGRDCFEEFIKKNMATILTGDNSVYCVLPEKESISDLLNHEKSKEIINSFFWLCCLNEEVREWCES